MEQLHTQMLVRRDNGGFLVINSVFNSAQTNSVLRFVELMAINVFHLQHLFHILGGTNVLITFRLLFRKVNGVILIEIK